MPAKPFEYGPFDGAIEHIGPVVVHPEHEAAVDHHTEVVQPPNRRVIVTTDVLVFALIREVGRIYSLEADEQTAQSGSHAFLQQPRLFQHRLDRAGSLPQPPHAAHAVEERLGEGWTAKEMVIEKVQVASRKTFDLGQRVLDRLYVVLLPALEKGHLIAEVADVRTAARDDDRVGNEVLMPLDQIAADWRHTEQGPLLRRVA